ncbi:MAG: transposase [Anaerolineaceae bacterium]|nr:transposase [Anaerolineaceae bacterium]
MEVKLYFRMLTRGWWIILLTMFTAIDAALILDYFAEPSYQATVRMLVIPNPEISTGKEFLDSLETLDQRSIIMTYAEMIDSQYMFVSVEDDLGLNSEELEKYEQKTVVLPDATIMELTVSGPDRKVVAIWANQIASEAIQYVNNLYQVYVISILDEAKIPTEASSPKPARDVMMAAAMGILVGAMMAIIREQLRTPIEALRHRRIIDHSSSAFTRRYFDQLVDDEALQARKEATVFSLVLIRLEGLRGYYDTLPHPIIDRLLQNSVRILRKELRGNDVIGRWDDLQFALLLPSTPYMAASNIMKRVRWELSQPMDIPETGEKIDLFPTTGVARSRDEEPVDMLVNRLLLDLEEKRDAPLERPLKPVKPTAPKQKQDSVLGKSPTKEIANNDAYPLIVPKQEEHENEQENDWSTWIKTVIADRVILITDEQWEKVTDFVPEKEMKSSGRGRPQRYSDREILDGILAVMRNGGNWRDLSNEYPSHQTCYRRFQEWRDDGTFELILKTLLQDLQFNDFNMKSIIPVDDTLAIKDSEGKIAKIPREEMLLSWKWHTALVLLSPYTRKVLKRLNSPLLNEMM